VEHAEMNSTEIADSARHRSVKTSFDLAQGAGEDLI